MFLRAEASLSLPPGWPKLKRKVYEQELVRLQEELVRLQRWIRHQGLKVVVIWELPVDEYADWAD